MQFSPSPRLHFQFRHACLADLDALVALEDACFDYDKLSRRSLRRWLKHAHSHFLVAEHDSALVGYSLCLYLRGTRLARLYSLAVHPTLRGQGLAATLLQQAEQAAVQAGCFYMRLEVSDQNEGAIRLYHRHGFKDFGLYSNYYDDHSSAIRMQKRIRTAPQNRQTPAVSWLPQSTEFTCGPAALMMAMHSLTPAYTPSKEDEYRIWREATTIFMTSGHGGCHPAGLALSAHRRGFRAEIWLNQAGPLFLDGVRQAHKKVVMEVVHDDYMVAVEQAGIPVQPVEVTQQAITRCLEAGGLPIILISTYRLDGKKAPHWVAISGCDEDCLYVHDPDPQPDPSSGDINPLDGQFMPIAWDEFERMSLFGSSRLRTAVFVYGGEGVR